MGLRDAADVDVRGEGGRADDRVEDVVDIDDPVGDVTREEVACEAVEEADEAEDDGVPDHDVAVAEPVGELADGGCGEDVDDGADGEKDGHAGRGEAVFADEHVGREREENLFAGAVEEFQRVEFVELAMEVEFRAFCRFVRSVLVERADGADDHENGDQAPYNII